MFWDVFYNLCLKRGISPNSVCKTIGLSNSMATYWQNGTMPKSDVLIQIADYFNVSTDYLLGRTDSPETTTDSQSENPTPSGTLESDFIRIFNDLSTEDKIRVLYQAVELKNKDKK